MKVLTNRTGGLAVSALEACSRSATDSTSSCTQVQRAALVDSFVPSVTSSLHDILFLSSHQEEPYLGRLTSGLLVRHVR